MRSEGLLSFPVCEMGLGPDPRCPVESQAPSVSGRSLGTCPASVPAPAAAPCEARVFFTHSQSLIKQIIGSHRMTNSLPHQSHPPALPAAHHPPAGPGQVLCTASLSEKQNSWVCHPGSAGVRVLPPEPGARALGRPLPEWLGTAQESSGSGAACQALGGSAELEGRKLPWASGCFPSVSGLSLHICEMGLPLALPSMALPAS